jgi:cysteine desulfurase
VAKKTHQTKLIYLDYAAATPVDPKVIAAMEPYYDRLFFNPSANYYPAQQVKADLNSARANVALMLGAKPAEVIFTAGGTEANNLAIYGVMSQFPAANIIVSSIEHESVLAPAEKYNHKLAPVHQDGLIDIEALAKLIDDQTVMLSIMYANNEIGTIQSLSAISRLITKVRQTRQNKGNKLPLYLHSDACQAGDYLDIHVDRLGLNLMTLNGGKIYGPKQSGVLYVSRRTTILPQILGGGQEMGYRSGTENVAGAIGFSTALKLAQTNCKQNNYKMKNLQNIFIDNIRQLLPNALINGSLSHRLPNNIHLTLPGMDNERILYQLDERGILAASGSACSASSQQPSHVLTALGFNDDYARSSLRFSMGRQTSSSDIVTTVKTLQMIVNS